MKTTYFRPSIHGWPFGNQWTKSIIFEEVTLDMGFCGGMCWEALKRFYGASPILRDEPMPSEGDDLYDEIWDTQKKSVPVSTLWKIYWWHASPDLDHSWSLKSLGERTTDAWPSVKSSLNNSKPVTITLIASSNDYFIHTLDETHRVVAYAYDIASNFQGGPRGADSKVTIWIYDPNFPDIDDVKLTFYLGAEDHNIRLHHNKTQHDDRYRGFFKDDKDRDYAHLDTTNVQIVNCVQTGISSRTRADYNFTFSWKCRFIPYFNILIDNESWQYNEDGLAKSQYQPTDKSNKQCYSRTGSLTVSLELPRKISTVAVKLLNDDTFYESIEVDARPAIKCYPYMRSRAFGEIPCVCDNDIEDTDLFIKDANPSDDAVEQLDTSEFRWVMNVSKGHVDTRRKDRDDLTTAHVSSIEKKRLGNVIVPILANFEERNLATPTVKSGTVQTFRNGEVITTDLDPFHDQAQKIFDGFLDNPSDFDNDTRVEFTYRSRDFYGLIVSGKAIFYGKSILYDQSTNTVNVFDPDKLARLEGIARYMVERGLIDDAINPPTPWPGPQPDPLDPVILINEFRNHKEIQGMIDQAFQSSWDNQSIWKQIWNAQSKFLEEAEIGKAIHIEGIAKKGKVLEATKHLHEKKQRDVDAVVLNIVVKRTLNKLLQDPKFNEYADAIVGRTFTRRIRGAKTPRD